MVEFSQLCSTFVAHIRKQACKVTQDLSSDAAPHDLTCTILGNAAQLLDEGWPASSTLLSVVAPILEKTIADCGDKFSKDTYERSSGHLLPSQKPQLRPKRKTCTFDITINQLMRESLRKARSWVFEDSEGENTFYQADGTMESSQQVAKMYTILQDWSFACATKCSRMDDLRSMTAEYKSRQRAGLDSSAMSLALDVKILNAIHGDDDLAAALALTLDLQDWASEGSGYAATPSGLVDVLAMGLEGTKEGGSIERTREWLAKLFMSSN